MKAEYTSVFFDKGADIVGPQITVDLPFKRTSSRAIIVRISDGAIVGTQHTPGGKYALPGGSIDDRESSADAILRELEEENIQLLGDDQKWQHRMAVKYFDGYKELAIWYVFVVDEVIIGPCDENIETKWFRQDEDAWHPLLHKSILLVLEEQIPDLVNVSLVVQ